jgi:lipoate---protein ligase
MIHVFNTGVGTASSNMFLDEKLLNELDPNGTPVLHLYNWAGLTATYGYFIEPKKFFDLTQVAKWNLDIARRPTGGGIVFHISDLAFSFLLPSNHRAFSLNTLENYQFVNGVVLEVAKEFFQIDSLELISNDGALLGPDCQHFCMARPTPYDVVYRGLKIAGAAQRRRKQGYLHQGTISLALPPFDLLNDVLLSKSDVLEAMRSYTFAPLLKVSVEARSSLEKLLAEKLTSKLNSFS